MDDWSKAVMRWSCSVLVSICAPARSSRWRHGEFVFSLGGSLPCPALALLVLPREERHDAPVLHQGLGELLVLSLHRLGRLAACTGTCAAGAHVELSIGEHDTLCRQLVRRCLENALLG